MTKSTNGKSAAAEKPVLNGIKGGVSAGEAAPEARALDPEVLAQITAFKTRIQASVGEVVLAMLNLPRYRNQTLADVMHLVVEPMTRDRIAIAKSGGEGKMEETAGIAIWASVSDEVDAKIREQIQARVFPVRLKAEDWNSGETTWLLGRHRPLAKSRHRRARELQAGREGQAGADSSDREPVGRSGGAGEDEGKAGGRGGGEG